MYLVHDVLDKELVGRGGDRMGRVDGLVLHLRADAPPCVTFIEMGAATLARRLPRLLAWPMERLARRFGRSDGKPYRIPWERVTRVGAREIEVDIDVPRCGALAAERWLRDQVIGRIPGSG